MKLNIGDYVRTKNGIIGKLQINKRNIAVANWNGDYELEEITEYIINNNEININEIVKSSPNIIDLIEVGDYVNGRIVCKNDEEGYLYLIGFDADGNFYEDSIKDIKSIVTKEMYSSVEYRVENN